MPSENKPPVLAFPKNKELREAQEAARVTAAQEVLVALQADENSVAHAAGHGSVPELCQDARRSLIAIRHLLENTLRGVVEKLDVDTGTLVHLLDERRSGVIDLMNGELDDLTTETLIEYLEKLGPRCVD